VATPAAIQLEDGMTANTRGPGARHRACLLGALGAVGALALLASLPEPANAAGDPKVRNFVVTVLSIFDHAQSAREAGTGFDDRIQHSEWVARTGHTIVRTVDGRRLFRRMDGHGGRRDRTITKPEIRRWIAPFDLEHDGLSDKEASDAAHRYNRLVIIRTAVA
jgi:hypothetical protein